jgi:hypothetical protein
MTPTFRATALLALTLAGCGGRSGLDVMAGTRPAAQPKDASTLPDASRFVDSVAPADVAARDAVARCNDGGPSELAYVLDGAGVLYRFNLSNEHYEALGTPECDDSNGLWTMTVSRENAYIAYQDGAIFAVDLTTLACSQTAFQPGQLGLEDEFGLAIAAIGGAEKLFVYGETSDGTGPIIAESDLSSFVLAKVADVTPAPPPGSFTVNLTADAFGHLYAFSPDGTLLQIDTATGALLQRIRTGVTTDGTWAQATYGGNDFLFVDSRVAEYDIATHAKTLARKFPVGAIGGGSVVLCPDE